MKILLRSSVTALVVGLLVPQAIATADQAHRTPPPAVTTDSANDHVRSGLALARQRQWQEAIAEFNQALSLDPSAANAYLFRGQVEAALKDYDGALRSFGEALRLQPHEATVYQAIADVHEARGDNDGATRALGLAANIHLRQDSLEEARAIIQHLREIAPGSPLLAELERRVTSPPAATTVRP